LFSIEDTIAEPIVVIGGVAAIEKTAENLMPQSSHSRRAGWGRKYAFAKLAQTGQKATLTDVLEVSRDRTFSRARASAPIHLPVFST
jgi:hypothetical protein